jgi:hypothetical protein
MKESIISIPSLALEMEIRFNVFLMPPIPKALRFSFPFLMACKINIRWINRTEDIKEIYLEGKHCVGCKPGRGRMRWPESSGNGNMEESLTCVHCPTMEVEFGLGFPNASHSYYS